MKRAVCFLLTIVFACSMMACTGSGANITQSAKIENLFTESGMIERLNDFIGTGEVSRRDRTAFSPREKAAAEYIAERLSSYGYVDGESLEIQNFSVEVSQRTNNVQTDLLNSQNVIATFNGGKQNTVIVGANYDNQYSEIEKIGYAATENENIFDGATGVAVLLELAETLMQQSPELDFTVQLVFFGCGEVAVFGSGKYVGEYLKDTSNVLLMINLDSVAGDRLNIYSDEVDTVEGKLFLKNGEAYDTQYAAAPRSLPLFPQQYAENLNYSHGALIGDQASFFEKGIPVIRFFGGDINGFYYYNTKGDTLETFKSDYPGYAATMADTASLIYGTLTDKRFTEYAQTFRTDKFDYSFFMGGYYAYIVYIGLIVLLAVALILVIKRLEKKYPFKPTVKRVKIAVFGMEYEDKSESDIFVDIKPNNGSGNSDEIDPFN